MSNIKLSLKSFEYIELPSTRFIGIDALRTGECYSMLLERKSEFMPALDSSKAAFPYECAIKHHDFKEADNPMHYIVGKFVEANTFVPTGYDYIDFPPMKAAYATFDGKFDDVGEVVMPIYEFTRNKILEEGVSIPYPEAYWSAEVYLKHPDADGGYELGYLFSVK